MMQFLRTGEYLKRERIKESFQGKKEKGENETEEKKKEKTGEKCARKESCNRKMYDQVCLAPSGKSKKIFQHFFICL